MKFKIKSWITGKVIITLEGENFKAAFMTAFAAGQRFEYADLSGMDLSKLNIKFGCFYGTKFYGTTFDGTKFDGTKFDGTKFDGTTFYGTKFDGTKFDGTKFYGTTFDGTKFDGTTFDGTKFDGTTFYGTTFKRTCFAGKEIVDCARPIFAIHPLGSEQRTMYAVLTKKGIHILTGCFSGSVDEFKAAIEKKHGDNAHDQEYLAALTLVELHFKLWGK